ncbi:MAG: hypothetical protein F7C38_06450 [Desulfurococcales archaeon]|nr:hypothetical protein [Desulfurococcales archaeon]
MNKIKAIIIISFIATIISAVIGVAVYYSFLSPFRAAANEGNLEEVLGKVTYIEYNVSDQQGNKYIVKVENNPTAKSGVAELYSGDSLEYKVYYNYSGSGLTYARIEYSNGTVKEYRGADVVVLEDFFLTSLKFNIEPANLTVTDFSPFPGVAPVYLPKFLGERLQVNWDMLASIRRGTGNVSSLMEVRVGMGKLVIMGKEVSGATLVLNPSAPNPTVKWSMLSYSMFLTDMKGLPVVGSWSVSITTPGQEYRLTYNLVTIHFSG